MISKEELERARKIFAEAERIEAERSSTFWKETYPGYTNNQKARYWSNCIYQWERSNAEYGIEAERSFAGQYEDYKKDEPQLDDLLEDIAKYLRYKPEDFIRILKEGK